MKPLFITIIFVICTSLYFAYKEDVKVQNMKDELETLKINTRYVDAFGNPVPANIVRLMVIDHAAPLNKEDSLILQNYLNKKI